MQALNLERAVILKRRLDALNEQIERLNALVALGSRVEIALDILQPNKRSIPLPDSLVDNVLRLVLTKLESQHQRVMNEINEL